MAAPKETVHFAFVPAGEGDLDAPVVAELSRCWDPERGEAYRVTLHAMDREATILDGAPPIASEFALRVVWGRIARQPLPDGLTFGPGMGERRG